MTYLYRRGRGVGLPDANDRHREMEGDVDLWMDPRAASAYVQAIANTLEDSLPIKPMISSATALEAQLHDLHVELKKRSKPFPKSAACCLQ